MKSRLLVGFFVMTCLLVLSAPLTAHHSINWAEKEATTLTGKLVEFKFINPHVVLYMEVTDEKGAVQKWTVEGTGPARLRRAGWDNDTLKPGTTISVVGGKARDGRLLINARKFIVNGKEINSEERGAAY